MPIPRLLTGEAADSENKLKGPFAQLELNMALGKSPEPLFFRLWNGQDSSSSLHPAYPHPSQSPLSSGSAKCQPAENTPHRPRRGHPLLFSMRLRPCTASHPASHGSLHLPQRVHHAHLCCSSTSSCPSSSQAPHGFPLL